MYDLDTIPLSDLLAKWADRHRGERSRAGWIAEITGLPRRQCERLLAGQRSNMEPLLRRFMELHDREPG